MENKTSYTLQDAVAIEMKFKNFEYFADQCQPYEVEEFAVKLIEKATEELRKENEALRKRIDTDWYVVEQNKEIAHLTQSNKELAEKTLDYMVTFNLSTSYTSVEEAKEELPKLFESKKNAAKEWIESLEKSKP